MSRARPTQRGGARGEARADDVERPARPVRRPSPAPAAIGVARVAASVVPGKPKRQVAASRRGETKTRTALVAPARGEGARLQLDPPRILVAQQRPATPVPAPAAAAAGLLAPAVALASTVPPPPAAPPPNLPVTLARAATDPLLAQVAAAAAAASGVGTPSGASAGHGSRAAG